MATMRNNVNKRFRKARIQRSLRIYATTQLELMRNWFFLISVFIIVALLITFCYKYFFKLNLSATTNVQEKIVSFPVVSYQEKEVLEKVIEEISYVHPEDDLVYQELLGREICDLKFWSNKSGGYYVTPPQHYTNQLIAEGFDCRSQKWLSRLAHYESEFNPNVCNTIYCGLYQIGPDARDMCRNNGRNRTDHDCADYLKDWLPQMPLMFEAHYRNKNSFSDI